MLVLDLEHLFAIQNPRCQTSYEAEIDNYKKYVDWFKNYNPATKIGFYDDIPQHDLGRITQLDPDTNRRNIALDLMADNNKIKSGGLASAVDFLAPSLYVHDGGGVGTESAWKSYAFNVSREARRIAGHKPVYAYVWYKFIDILINGQEAPISMDFWRTQLEFLRANNFINGLVIWDNGTPRELDVNEDWWKEVARFMKQNGLKAGVRRIRIEKNNNADNVLNFSEIEIYSNGVNVARPSGARVTKASSDSIHSEPFSADKAIDGDLWNIFANSGNNTESYWEIDLGDSFNISEVKIYNRHDCCQDRINPSKITFFDANNNTGLSTSLR
jgi:hypothetical protein